MESVREVLKLAVSKLQPYTMSPRVFHNNLFSQVSTSQGIPCGSGSSSGSGTPSSGNTDRWPWPGLGPSGAVPWSASSPFIAEHLPKASPTPIHLLVTKQGESRPRGQRRGSWFPRAGPGVQGWMSRSVMGASSPSELLPWGTTYNLPKSKFFQDPDVKWGPQPMDRACPRSGSQGEHPLSKPMRANLDPVPCLSWKHCLPAAFQYPLWD